MKKLISIISILVLLVALPCFAQPPASSAPTKVKMIAQDDNSNRIANTAYVDTVKQGMLQVPAGASDCVLGYSGIAYGCYKSWRVGNVLLNNSMTSDGAVTVDTTNYRFKFRSGGVNYALPAARDIHYEIDGYGSEIATGIKGDIYFTHPAKIKSVTLLAGIQSISTARLPVTGNMSGLLARLSAIPFHVSHSKRGHRLMIGTVAQFLAPGCRNRRAI